MSPASSKSARAGRFRGAAALAVGPIAVLGAGGVCPGGSSTLAMVTRISPECFDSQHCSELCTPIGDLISEYFRTRDRAGVQAQVCANPGVFRCVFQPGNVEPCGKVLSAGRKMVADLPASSGELDRMCGHRLLSASAASPAVCPGSNPMVSVVTDIAPQCFAAGACSDVCGPLGGLVDKYMASGDTSAIKESVCAAPGPFRCLFDPSNAEHCSKVLSAGSALGVTLPTTNAELDEQCGGGEAEANTTGGPGEDHQSAADGRHEDVQDGESVPSRGARPGAWSVAAAAVLAGSVLPAAAAHT